MNTRQRDRFLWQWSQRRRLGQANAFWRGILIGTIGGLAFAAFLGTDIGFTELKGQNTLHAFGQIGLLLAMSVPTFALMGGLGAWRLFRSHEQMFQDLLHRGAQVPMAAPVLALSDRGPAIAVAVAATIVASSLTSAVIFLG